MCWCAHGDGTTPEFEQLSCTLLSGKRRFRGGMQPGPVTGALPVHRSRSCAGAGHLHDHGPAGQLTLCGDLPCRRIGRLVQYTEEDIEAFVQGLDDRATVVLTRASPLC